MLGWMKHKLESRLPRAIINILRYADDTTIKAESEEKLRSLLIKVKEESGKADLKLNIQKTKITASGPITSWQIDGETHKNNIRIVLWKEHTLQSQKNLRVREI